MADISPAAQAVLDATLGEGCVSWRDRRRIAAAAILAAADQVASAIPDDCSADVFNRQLKIRFELHALANELQAR